MNKYRCTHTNTHTHTHTYMRAWLVAAIHRILRVGRTAAGGPSRRSRDRNRRGSRVWRR